MNLQSLFEVQSGEGSDQESEWIFRFVLQLKNRDKGLS